MSLLSTLHISHVIVELESLFLALSRKMFARNPRYESLSTLEQNDVIALLSTVYSLWCYSHTSTVLFFVVAVVFVVSTSSE